MENKEDLLWLMSLEVSALDFWTQGEVQHPGERPVVKQKSSLVADRKERQDTQRGTVNGAENNNTKSPC